MNMSKKIGSVALALMVGLGLASGPALADGGKSRNWKAPEALVGAWRVTITPYVCGTTTEFPQFAFQSFLTFAKGGTMLETNFNPNFQPGQRSVGHGYWVRNGKGTYHSVFEAFVYFQTDPPATPPRPNYQPGSQRLAQDIEMVDADNWKSLAEVSFYDTAGTQVSSGCAKAEAERMW